MIEAGELQLEISEPLSESLSELGVFLHGLLNGVVAGREVDLHIDFFIGPGVFDVDREIELACFPYDEVKNLLTVDYQTDKETSTRRGSVAMGRGIHRIAIQLAETRVS